MKLSNLNKSVFGKIKLPASKSESNRVLIIQALLAKSGLVKNTSTAEDTSTLMRILKEFGDGTSLFDVGPAGTTMRFLTAFFALQKGQQMITGSERMLQRPVKILVDALRELGASIDYLCEEGFPPLRINESSITGGEIEMDGGVSSQYLSALMLVAPHLKNGLEIQIKNKLVSRPYLEMTANLMTQFGAELFVSNEKIAVKPIPYREAFVTVESDWSAASYWYEIVAFSEEAEVELVGLRQNSLQGDSVVAQIFKSFGVETTFLSDSVIVKKVSKPIVSTFEYDFTLCPDLAQTIAVTCAGLGIEAKLTGLKTLRIKETDRIVALKCELEKFGFDCSTGEDFIQINQLSIVSCQLSIETYHDHRMAMAFAPLAILVGEIGIENHGVVGKSYPEFWNHLAEVGFLCQR